MANGFKSFPGVPMVYAPQKMDTTFSNELAARLCREYTREAVERMAEIMRMGNDKNALTAANALLDRAYGKPKEVSDMDNQGRIPKFKVEVEFVDVIDQKPKASPVEMASTPSPDFMD